MIKKKPEYIISAIFVSVIMFFMCAVLVRFIGAKVFYIDFAKTTQTAETGEVTSETSGVDWVSLYPFDENNSFDYQCSETEAQYDTSSSKWTFKDQVELLESRVDYYTSNLLFGRMKFIEANALFNKSVGMKIISGTDSVIVMNNGYLTFQSYSVDTDYSAAGIEWFNSELEKRGINFLYVQYPSKESPYDNKLPVGVEDYKNANADSLIEKLEETDVEFIDLRKSLNMQYDNWFDAFFRTDHHWKPETGLWAAGQIADVLNEKCGYEISDEIDDIDNYNVRVYEDYCLGSQGKISTLRYTDPEDFTLITPKKETSFTVDYHSDHGGTGSYEDVLIDMRALEKIDYYGISTYSAYLYGTNAVTSIKNNNVHNGKRLLVLSDSFCKCVVPVLAQEIEYIDIVDRRYFSGSILSYIDSFCPDTVIAAYTTSMITDIRGHSGMYNFE